MNAILLLLPPMRTVTCAFADGPYFPIKTKAGEPGVSAFEAQWYGKYLKQMKEPRLPEAAEDTNTVIYRMTVLPTSGKPVVVRVQRLNGLYNLSARRLDEKAGCDPSKMADRKDVQLSQDDSGVLDLLIADLKFFEMPTDDKVRGCDGVQSIIEGVSGGKYHVVQRWCAASMDTEQRGLKAFVALCEFLINKSTLLEEAKNQRMLSAAPVKLSARDRILAWVGRRIAKNQGHRLM